MKPTSSNDNGPEHVAATGTQSETQRHGLWRLHIAGDVGLEAQVREREAADNPTLEAPSPGAALP